jgi:glycosyltransferase involved in cell wall biosynthesis
MNKKTIWYLHPYAGGPNLGNSARPYHLASAWIEQGANATVFCSSWHHLMSLPKQLQEDENIEGVPYCFIPTRKYQGNGVSRMLHMTDYCLGLLFNRRKYENKFGRPNVIVASSPHPYTLIPAWFLARIFRAKLVFEVRDLWPLSLVELAGLSKWHPLVVITGWIELFAYRQSDATVSLLPGAKNYMVSKGLKPKNYHYIPNGARLIDQDSSTAHLKNRHQLQHPVIDFALNSLKQGHFVVIYPGAMGPPNNMKPLIKAASIIAQASKSHIQFILLGQGGDIAELQQMSKDYNLHNVHFFSQVDRSIALELMRIASAGYVSVKRLPIYKYGISFNKLFEYMQQRLPVIFAADVQENPIEVSGAGVVTSPDQPELIAASIIELSEKTVAQRQEMGQLGLNYIIQFHDYRILSEQYLAIF